jgi:hypothetical protein
MSTDTNQVAEQQENVTTEETNQPEVDYKALYEETQKKLETVAAHKDKLYAETKKAKAEREAAEAEKQKIATETAKKNGEYEKLWQQEQKEKQELLDSLSNLKKGYRNDKIEAVSMRVATELADGDNADLLSTFVRSTLDSLADETGSLSDDVLKGVVNEYQNNPKFKALLRGSKATGGGAPGNTSSAGVPSKTVDLATYNSWDADKQIAFQKSGGKFK